MSRETKIQITHIIGGVARVINKRGAFDFLQAQRRNGLIRTAHFGFGPGGDPACDVARLSELRAAAAEAGVEVSQ